MSKNNSPQQFTLDNLDEATSCDQGVVRTEALIEEATGTVKVRVSVDGFTLDEHMQLPQLEKSVRSFGGVINVTELDATGLTLHFEEGRLDDLKALTMQVKAIRREAAIKLNSIHRQRAGEQRHLSAPNSPFNHPEPIPGATRMTKGYFASLNGF